MFTLQSYQESVVEFQLANGKEKNSQIVTGTIQLPHVNDHHSMHFLQNHCHLHLHCQLRSQDPHQTTNETRYRYF